MVFIFWFGKISVIITTVRLEYDDTHSDQGFAESEPNRNSAWAFLRDFHAPRG